MMTPEEWLKVLSSPMGKKAAQSLGKHAADIGQIDQLIKLTFYHKYEVAFRAAWVLEHSLDIVPDAFELILPEFLAAYVQQSNPSCKRHYTKILMFLLARHKPDDFTDNSIDLIIDTTFEWVIDPETPVAVRVNCLDILYALRDRSDWITTELKSQILFLLRDGSPAMLSRGKRLLKRLKH